MDRAPGTGEISPTNVSKFVRYIATTAADRFKNQPLTLEQRGPEESKLWYGVVRKRNRENPNEYGKSNANNGFSQHGFPVAERYSR